jgi:hypothetical protein
MMARRAVVRRAQDAEIVQIEKVHTDVNLADMFTKPLPRDKFLKLRDLVIGCVPVSARAN